MTMLIAAAVAFLAIHLLVSGTRVRDAIAGAIGERPYLGLFSLASLAIIIWLIVAYNGARASGNNSVLYDLGHVRDLGIPIVALAFLLGLQGLLIRNPTAVQQESATARDDTVHGVLRITRHPFLWGVVLWSGFHLLANGDVAAVTFFGTFFVTALLGTFSIDAKAAGEAWAGVGALRGEDLERSLRRGSYRPQHAEHQRKPGLAVLAGAVDFCRVAVRAPAPVRRLALPRRRPRRHLNLILVARLEPNPSAKASPPDQCNESRSRSSPEAQKSLRTHHLKLWKHYETDI